MSKGSKSNLKSSNITNNYIETEIKKFKESLREKNREAIMFEAEKKIYSKESFKKQTLLIEKVLNTGVLKKKYLKYRNYPDPTLKVKSQGMMGF